MCLSNPALSLPLYLSSIFLLGCVLSSPIPSQLSAWTKWNRYTSGLFDFFIKDGYDLSDSVAMPQETLKKVPSATVTDTSIFSAVIPPSATAFKSIQSNSPSPILAEFRKRGILIFLLLFALLSGFSLFCLRSRSPWRHQNKREVANNCQVPSDAVLLLLSEKPPDSSVIRKPVKESYCSKVETITFETRQSSGTPRNVHREIHNTYCHPSPTLTLRQGNYLVQSSTEIQYMKQFEMG
ncbi:unnamed protein product [Protopolystoma xenopodis]|uniref:Transmembrane protein n=1 Tax=Protopolystoma xenopodis TaxID=117903 RepID=A0A3S4ZTR5_9PLAT|nr:unnamed protein product [Protopolystoma xenopodis]